MKEKIFDSNFFASLNQLKMASRMKMNAGMSGSRKSSDKGTSVEFADFREYILGDDIRRIDWNAFGRMDKLFVRLFMQEKEGMYTILLDSSASMDFGEKSKAVYSERVAGALGYLALSNLDRVRFGNLYKDQARLHQSLTGKQSLNRYLQQIEATRFEGETDLYMAVQRIPFKRNGVTVILSDFFDKETSGENLENIRRLVKYLRYRNQDVLLVQVLSREEEAPDYEGTVGLQDSENQQELTMTMSGMLLREYQKSVQTFQREIEKICRYYHAYYMKGSSEQLLSEFIYYGMKAGQIERI